MTSVAVPVDASNTPRGVHLICDLWTESRIDSEEYATSVLLSATEAGKATLYKICMTEFPGGGVSGVAIIGESHISMHTWPEAGYISIDAFSCSPTMDLDAIQEEFVRAYPPNRIVTRTVLRGTGAFAGLNPGYFVEAEPGSPGRRIYPAEEPVCTARTGYQDLVLFKSPGLGRVLALDGIVQCSDVDEYAYHELLVHPALCAHESPRAVVVVGGGDGGALREVLRHEEVERVLVLELDAGVVLNSRDYFEEADLAFADPRVEVRYGDAFDNLSGLDFVPDVMICDMVDPVGQAARFFSRAFYERVASVLSSPGVMVAQTQSLHFHRAVVADCFHHARAVFGHAEIATCAMASYPGAWWTFTVASRDCDVRVAQRQPELATRLYHPSDHGWYFLPESVRDSMLRESPVSAATTPTAE